MRYELNDYEWSVIQPMLPNKPRGVPRVDDRRVLNGIFWVLRSGAPWRDLPKSYGPPTTCYNRFVRWRRAGIWDRIMNGLATAHNAAMQMIDTSIVRVHQPSASVLISTGHVIWSSGSSTRSSNAGVLPLDMTNSLPITSPSSSLLRSGSGYGLMSPRPSWDAYPKSWPRASFASTPLGVMKFNEDIRRLATQRLTDIRSHLKSPGPHYPEQKVREAFAYWKIVI